MEAPQIQSCSSGGHPCVMQRQALMKFHNTAPQVDLFVFTVGHTLFFVVSGTSNSVVGVVVGSAGHEIDLAGSEGLDGTKVDIIKPQVDRFVFPVAHDVMVSAGKADFKIWVATMAICPSRCRVPSRSKCWRSLIY